jgi:hypothetical protein
VSNTAALAQGRGHGGGGMHMGGGGGMHMGGGGGMHMGGGGGMHMGGGGGMHLGGGGGMHMGGGGGMHMGGGGMHMGGGGGPGAFRMGGGGPHIGGGFHSSGGFRMGDGGHHPNAGGMHGFTAYGTGGHSFAGRGFGGPGFARHGFASQGSSRFMGRNIAEAHHVPGAHNGSGAHNIAAHDRFNAANRMNTRGEFAHNQFGSIHGSRTQFVHNELAHNHFVARNFHGLHNFNHTGFNRNAFGDPNNWNQWGSHFWGRGWNRWGHGWGFWAGPVFWPFIFGDIFTFAFWPSDYYDPFWFYGPDFLLISIFAPGPYFGGDYGYAPDYWYDGGYSGGYGGRVGSPNIYYGGAPTYGGVTQKDQQALAATNAAAKESCSSLAPGVTDFPIERIKQAVQPTGDQLTALNDLSAATAKANDIIKASCPAAVPLTPVARLETAEARLEAVMQAVDVVHEPLVAFLASLSDEQKQRFENMGSKGKGRAPASGDAAALCSQQSGGATNLPIERIEQVVELSDQRQQDAFAALKQASRDTAAQLQASCPSQVPQALVERLDAVKTRLQAMVDAMNTVRPKLQAFYSSLSDDQKARFNTMAPPQNASAATQGSNR